MNNYCVETSDITGQDYTRIEPEVAGIYELNGVQATSYARIRYTAGLDFERTERQRLILQKLVQKAKKSSLGTLSSIMDEVFPLVKTSLSKSQIFDMGAGMLSYSFDETCGFPYEHTEKDIEGKGSVVLPVTLDTNVKELHKFLFKDDNYSPSDVVVHRSEKIAEIGGIEVTKDSDSSEKDSMSETQTSTPESDYTEDYQETSDPTETEYTDSYQDYGSEYTDTSYVDTYDSSQQSQEPYSGDTYQDTSYPTDDGSGGQSQDNQSW